MATSEIVHACPPVGQDVTTCCGRTPFDLPRTDRLTNDPADVTCGTAIRGTAKASGPTPCGPTPQECDGAEPCDRHEIEQAHADGEHELCDQTCKARGTTGQEIRQQIAEALMQWAEHGNNPAYAAARRPETVTKNAYDRADAVLPVVRTALDVEYRRALTVAADLLSAQEMDDAAAVVRYLSTPYTVDTNTTKEN